MYLCVSVSVSVYLLRDTHTHKHTHEIAKTCSPLWERRLCIWFVSIGGAPTCLHLCVCQLQIHDLHIHIHTCTHSLIHTHPLSSVCKYCNMRNLRFALYMKLSGGSNAHFDKSVLANYENFFINIKVNLLYILLYEPYKYMGKTTFFICFSKLIF